MSRNLERLFPGLKNTNYEITSAKTTEYNCIAWAAGDTNRWWWPNINYYWPGNLPLSAHVADFIKVFELMGFVPCKSGNPEEGFDKIAIYIDANNQVTHASRQLESGQWTSKLGSLEDIRHEKVEAICGTKYGRLAMYMKRIKLDARK